MMYCDHTQSVAKIEVVSYKRLTINSDRCALCGDPSFWCLYVQSLAARMPTVAVRMHKGVTMIEKMVATTAIMAEQHGPVLQHTRHLFGLQPLNSNI